MALPDHNAPWPPPEWAPYYDEMRLNDAWYTGSREKLAAVHGNEPQPRRRRSLWGRKSLDHAPGRDTRLHVPLPGDIASTSADLLFAEMPSITVTDTETQTRLETLLDEGRVQQTLLSGAEQASAMSGAFLRTTWDRSLAQRPILTIVQPDNAVPEYRWGLLSAVTFWRELPGSDTATVLRHLERHEPGLIEHGLYQGTPTNLGRRIPLTEHPETSTLVDSLDKDGDGTTVRTGIDLLTASYVPNMLPNRLHRGSPVGRSDYAAPLYDQFASIDETWTSWMRDIRLARGRLIVPQGFLRNEGPGRGASFDEDRDIWAGLNIPPNEASAGITLSQFAIRVEEHARTAEALVRQAAQSAGYSAQSFGLDGGGQPITATESDHRESRSEATTRKKRGYWRYGIAEQVEVMLSLDATLFGQKITPERPTVEFDTGATESPQSIATTLDLLARAGAISTATKVKTLHPEWDDAAVKAEIAAILAETGAAAPDPVGSFPM